MTFSSTLLKSWSHPLCSSHGPNGDKSSDSKAQEEAYIMYTHTSIASEVVKIFCGMIHKEPTNPVIIPNQASLFFARSNKAEDRLMQEIQEEGGGEKNRIN
jgi:hypothetical protein